MRLKDKPLGLLSLLILFQIAVFHGPLSGAAAQTAASGEKKPFTVDDALALEFLNHWSSPRFACREDLVAYVVVDKYYERSEEEEAGKAFVSQGSHIFIRSLREAAPVQLTEGAEYSWSPSWSPNGRKLAFYGLNNGRISLGIWDRMNGKREYLGLGGIHGSGPIVWDARSQRIFFVSNPVEWKGSPEPYEASEDPIIRTTEQEVNPYDARLLSWTIGQLSCFDLEVSRSALVTPRPMVLLSFQVSPDGTNAAVLELIENKIRVLDTTEGNLDIYPIGGGDPKRIVSKSGLTQYAWSPDGRFVAYVHEGRLFVYSLSENRSTPLSKDDMRISGGPHWLPGSREIFCAAGAGHSIFEVPTGTDRPIDIDGPFEKGPYGIDEQGKSLYFQVVDRETGKQGIDRFDLKKGRTEELISGDWMIRDFGLAGSRLFFTLQNATTPENLWMMDLRSKKRSQITELNKQAGDYAFGRSELISWKSSTGDPLKGVLLYPAGYEKGKTYPVVFWVYETFSSELHHFYVHLYNLQILTNQGYAVFLPDVNFVTGDTSLSYIRSVEPAQDRLIELGIANGSFGVMGHSYGGYATNAIVTHSKRFKAGVAISGISDWISFHGLPGDYMRVSNEQGQGRMGGDLREFPERYVKNSPVFY
ncbi:MAG: peptidase prolyl oligopeptidase active site domain protein, partial [Candidatus Aminicenantes bacterium]|nr:peptidase prolyl oligopeptidase active site domain protein [Candidatus Aminicenantes bacterium]